MWRFETYAADGGNYRWALKRGDGQDVAGSADAYQSESNAKHAAEHFRAIAPSWLYEISADGPGRYRWVAKAGNGHVVATSHQPMGSRDDAQRAADDVKLNAGRATGP